MHQLGGEEKAALLLTPAADDDDDDNPEIINSSLQISHEDFPVVSKRPKTYQRHRSLSTNPVLCFILIMAIFILGCLSGVIIMTYKMSQDAERESKSNTFQTVTNIDLSIRTKIFQSITKTNFLNFNHSIQSDIDSANKLYEQWQSLINVKKYFYDINLSQLNQWNGIELLDEKTNKELLKINHLSTEDILSFSSLIKSGTINGNQIYYVNYGRQEDFAYLFNNRIVFDDQDKSIVFMRRKSSIISQTEQIHQAIYYGFAGLVLFDDNENSQITTTNDRHSFFREWARFREAKDRENYLNGIMNDREHSISVLMLSYDDVQKLFESLESDSNTWLSCPNQWHKKKTSLKIGGRLTNFQIRLVVNTHDIQMQLPIVISSIQGTINPDQFMMIGYQLNSIEQNKIIYEIIKAFTNQIKNGWNPKRSILFCAWSGLDYDQYTARRWFSDNFRLIDRNLFAYIDLGNGIMANSTVNIHGSPLFEQIIHHAADIIPSPLKHNHTCHHRQMTTMNSNENNNHQHDHGRRRRDEEHQHHMEINNQPMENECEPHKLLDEWIRASDNRFGLNQNLGIVQAIDTDSIASFIQLQYGIPSIIIEMTDEQALVNDTFYVQRSSSIVNEKIEAEVYVAYTQFLSEIIRQLIDEPFISFNLTNYADQIDKQVKEYINHYERAYNSLSSHLGDRNEFIKTLNDLTTTIRQIQKHIDQIPKNDFIHLQSLNEKLINFERLFLTNEQLNGMNSKHKIYKHLLIGPAFGLTNTIVPFPFLSNILYNIPEDPPTEFCDASKIFWFKLREQISQINQTLNGLDGLLNK